MPATLSILIVFIVVAALFAGIFRALPGTPPAEIIHNAVGPYTPDQAHIVWQEHADCLMDRCPSLRTAYWTLVDAGRITPDARVAR